MLFGALIVAISAIFVTYVYLPLKKDVTTLQNQSTDLTIQIDDGKNKEKLINELKIEIAKLEEEIIAKQDNILKIWDQPELLNFIENTIGKLGEKKQISFFDAVDVAAIRSGDIEIMVDTNYDDLQKLFKKIETAKYLSTVQSFTISKNDKAAGTGNEKDDKEKEKEKEKDLKVTMVLRFYSQNQTAEYPEEYEFMDGKYGKKNIYK